MVSPYLVMFVLSLLVRIHARADDTGGCAREILFPDFGIDQIVPENGAVDIEFTPQQAGEFAYHCSMDMARGTLVVQ